ncbi:MAG: mannose-6-phosphate isomerase, partial [bacterium]
MYFNHRSSNYDCYPALNISGYDKEVWQGLKEIVSEIQSRIIKEKTVIVIDYYHGIRDDLINAIIAGIHPDYRICVEEAKYSEAYLSTMLAHHITEDRVFGSMSTHRLKDFYDPEKLEVLREQLRDLSGIIVVYGVGASLLTRGDILIYGD